nr:hypothetical protein [bacterium]
MAKITERNFERALEDMARRVTDNSSGWKDTGSSSRRSDDDLSKKLEDRYEKVDNKFKEMTGKNGKDADSVIQKIKKSIPAMSAPDYVGDALGNGITNIGSPIIQANEPQQQQAPVTAQPGQAAPQSGGTNTINLDPSESDEYGKGKGKDELKDEHAEAAFEKLLEGGMSEENARALVDTAKEDSEGSKAAFDSFMKKVAALPSGDLTEEEMAQGTESSREELKVKKQAELAAKFGTALAEAAGLSKTQAAEFTLDHMLRAGPGKAEIAFVRDTALGGKNKGHKITGAKGMEGYETGAGIFRKASAGNVPAANDKWYKDAACRQEIQGARYVAGENGAGKLVFDDTIIEGADDFATITDAGKVVLKDGVAYDVYSVEEKQGTKAEELGNKVLLHDSFNDKWYSADSISDAGEAVGLAPLANAPVRTSDGKRLVFDRALRTRAEFDVSNFKESTGKGKGLVAEFKGGTLTFKAEDGKRAERRVEEFGKKWKEIAPDNIRADAELVASGKSVEFKISADDAKAKEVAEWFGKPENAEKVNDALGLLKGSTPIEVKIGGKSVSRVDLGAAEFVRAAKNQPKVAATQPEGTPASEQGATPAADGDAGANAEPAPMGGTENADEVPTASRPAEQTADQNSENTIPAAQNAQTTDAGTAPSAQVTVVKNGDPIDTDSGKMQNYNVREGENEVQYAVIYDAQGKFEKCVDENGNERTELPKAFADAGVPAQLSASSEGVAVASAGEAPAVETPVDETAASPAQEQVTVQSAAPAEAPETMQFAQGFDLKGLRSAAAGSKLIGAVKDDPNFGKTKKIDLGTIKIDGEVTEEQLRSIVKFISIDTGVKPWNIKWSVEGDYKAEAPAKAVASAEAAPEAAALTAPEMEVVSGENAEKKSGPVSVDKNVMIREGDAAHVASKLIINIKKQARADGIETPTGAKVRVEGSSTMTKAEFAEVKKLVAEGLGLDESKVRIYTDGVAFRREAPAETATAEVKVAKPRGEKAEKKSGAVNVAETVDIGGRGKDVAASKIILKAKKQAIADGNDRPTGASVRVKGNPDMTEKEWREVKKLVAEGLGLEESKVEIDPIGVKFNPETEKKSVARNEERDEFLRDGQVAKKERKVTSEAQFHEQAKRKTLLAKTDGKAKAAKSSGALLPTITSLKPVGELRAQGARFGQMYVAPKGQEIFAIYGDDGKILGVKVVGSKTNEKHLGSVPENLKDFIPETIGVPKEDIFEYKDKEVLGATMKPLSEKDGV